MSQFNVFRVLGFVLVSLVFGNAQAISFDRLTSGQKIEVSTLNIPSSSTISSPSVIGGSRFMQVQLTGGFKVEGEFDASINAFFYSEPAVSRGNVFIIWDGNSAPGPQYAGLGGVDITADDATAFKVVVEGYDYPSNEPLKLEFAVYDASDPTGVAKASVGKLLLNKTVQSGSVTFELPFSDLVKAPSATAPASLKNVGAITLFIAGNDPNASGQDVAISFIGTNGRCSHIPVNGNVVDQCGVCGGDNSTCSDCNGVPNGPDLPGKFCSTGMLGLCSGGVWQGTAPASCSCKPDVEPTKEVCDKIDNNCDGIVDEGSPTDGPLVDDCGVCGGDSRSCLECRTFDQSDRLNALDGGAKEQEKIIRKAVASLRTIPGAAQSNAKFISQTLSTAHKLQLRNWTLSWTLPQIVNVCNLSTTFCITSSNTTILSEYRQHNQTLRKLAINVLNRAKKARRGKMSSAEKKLFKLTEKQFNDNLNLSNTVPELQFACS